MGFYTRFPGGCVSHGLHGALPDGPHLASHTGSFWRNLRDSLTGDSPDSYHLLGTVAVSGMSELRPLRPLSRPSKRFPRNLDGGRPPDRKLWERRSSKSSSRRVIFSRFYGGDSQRLGLFIAYYDRQTAGGTLHSPRNCLPGSGWEIWQQSSLKVAGAGDIIINRYSIRI